jgi:hypothetical protein
MWKFIPKHARQKIFCNKKQTEKKLVICIQTCENVEGIVETNKNLTKNDVAKVLEKFRVKQKLLRLVHKTQKR